MRRETRERLRGSLPALLLLGAIAAVVGVAIASNCARAEDNFAEVAVVNLQAIRELCWRHPYPAYDRGCKQSLAREDYMRGWRRNWASRDFQNGRGNYRGFDLCDGPTKWSGRSMYRVSPSSGGIMVFIRQRVRPPEAVGLFELYTYYVDQDHCWPDSLQLEPPIPGAYAKQFLFPERNELGPFPSSAQLDAVSDLPEFWTLPEYWDAYYAVAEALAEVQGHAYNPHEPWTREAQRYAWDNRQAVFAYLADGPVTEPHQRVEVWHTCKQLAELVILVAAYEDGDYDENRADLLERGWPLHLYAEYDPALDVIYLGTAPGGDPFGMFDDNDVAAEESSWGEIKRAMRARLPRRDLTR